MISLITFFKVEISVYSLHGELINQNYFTLPKGNHTIPINLAKKELNANMAMVSVKIGHKLIQTFKIVTL